MAGDTGAVDPLINANIMIVTAMLGALALDTFRMVTTKKFKLFNYILVTATTLYIITIIIDGAAFSMTGFAATFVPQLSTYLYLVSLIMLLYLYGQRTVFIHPMSPKVLPWFTYSIAPIFIFFRIGTNIINSIVADAAWRGVKNPVDANLRQAFRILMNIFAMFCGLYYELYTTLTLFTVSATAKGQNHAYSALRYYAMIYTFFICSVFIAQTALQINRALMFKRVFDFSDEYHLVSLGSDDPSVKSYAGKATGQKSQQLMVSTDFQDTSDYDPATVVNVMINSAMIGALLLDMLRLVTTKQLKRFNYAMVIATLFLLASMIIDAAQPSIVGYTSFSVPQTSTYLYLISLSLILWMYSERTKAIHSFSHPIHRYLTYGLGPVYLFFRLSVNVMNTMIASAKMQKLKSPVDPNLRQGFRTTMNLFALACALYYEFYTTRKIFKLSKAVKGANAAYNPIRNYSLLYTSLITIGD
ncbi:hypothetical protein EDD86DRAFT_246184 [Gorgonomyces haynaldii]|nr:hypothetical protein EDD86DRAFT_246184 [Gorgonomyces haynaldii]